MGRVCAGSQSGPGFTVQRTRCRMTPGPGDVTICHVDADCAPDGICVDGGSSNPGAPLLRICILPI